MDNRIPLQRNQILVLGEFPCCISRVLGRGSNAIVCWYPDALNPDQKHAVLIKELYPSRPQGGILRQEDQSLSVCADTAETTIFLPAPVGDLMPELVYMAQLYMDYLPQQSGGPAYGMRNPPCLPIVFGKHGGSVFTGPAASGLSIVKSDKKRLADMEYIVKFHQSIYNKPNIIVIEGISQCGDAGIRLQKIAHYSDRIRL